jgi:hypothetical protein
VYFNSAILIEEHVQIRKGKVEMGAGAIKETITHRRQTKNLFLPRLFSWDGQALM